MLTHIGETVSNAMTLLAELNSEISETHKELAEVEEQLRNAEVVEPELETATDEAFFFVGLKPLNGFIKYMELFN